MTTPDEEFERQEAARRAAFAERQRQRAADEEREAAERAERAAARAQKGREIEEAAASERRARDAQVAAIRARGQHVLDLAGQLGAGPDLPADPKDWLKKYAALDFEASANAWEQTQRNESGLFFLIEGRFLSEVKTAILGVRNRNQAAQSAEETRREQKTEASRQREKLDLRTQEAGRLGLAVNTHAQLDIKTPELDLLLRWLFGTALGQLLAHQDERIKTLLKRMANLRTEHAQGQDPPGGPYVEFTGNVGGYTGTGEAGNNTLYLTIGLPAADTPLLLTSDEHGHHAKLAELVTEVAKVFIHETAHLWQIQTYNNVSHPWPARQGGWTAAASELAKTGIPFDDWPEDVRKAYLEFENGGNQEPAGIDAEYKRIITALNNQEYFIPGIRDRRGRELVSHLIELVFMWNSADRFDRAFPHCAALLDRVINKGANPAK